MKKAKLRRGRPRRTIEAAAASSRTESAWRFGVNIMPVPALWLDSAPPVEIKRHDHSLQFRETSRILEESRVNGL